MNTIIDRWNRIKVSAEGEAQSHSDELRASRCEGQAHAIKIAIDDFVDACTPRAPRAEWFEKWDAWWLSGIGHFIVEEVDGQYIWGTFENNGRSWIYLPPIKSCVPVAREGFPAPVSWKVVES